MSDKKKEKISFYKFFKRFPDEASAEKFFAERRWGKDGKRRFCPHCGSVRTVTIDHKMPYRCKDCRKFFSALRAYWRKAISPFTNGLWQCICSTRTLKACPA